MRVNTKLESEFDLMPMEESSDEDVKEISMVPIEDTELLSKMDDLDKIDSALPQVQGMGAVENDLHDLAGKAVKAHDDLMELAMNVEEKYMGEIASTAAAMLGHAITAKTNIIKQKIDLINLQLKKKMIDIKSKADSSDDDLIGKGHVFDRNELLKELKNDK
jgi:hypothetical protein